MTRGMNITRKTFPTSSFVEGLPCAKTTSDSSACENGQRALGWMINHHGRHYPSAMALARSTWTNAPRVCVNPMVY
eukprot:5560640-Pyramimonas_sp.AAC.1